MVPRRLSHAVRRIRPPVVRQYDRSDCGPAALLSVLRQWGGDASLAEVRDLARTDLRGTTLLGLVRAAKALGMEARGVAGRLDDLAPETLPCLAHLTLGDGASHFVVVDRIGTKGVWVRDPGYGRNRFSREEFSVLWKSGAAILLRPTSHLHRACYPTWLEWVAGYLREERTWLLQSLFLGGVGAGLGLATAVFVQWLIDRFIPERDVEMILATGLALLILLVLRAGAGYLRQRFLLGLNHRVSVRVNEDFLRHLFRLPLRFFESRTTGDITARIADGLRIQQALLQIIGTAVIDGLLVIGSFLILFVLAPQLGWIAAGTLPVYAVILLRTTAQLEAEQKAAKSAFATVEAAYIDSLAGVPDILSFGVSTSFARKNATLYRLLQRRIERLGATQAAISLMVELAGALLIMAGLVWGALLVVQDALRLGQLIAGYTLLAGMLPSVERLVLASMAFHDASVAANRLRDLLLAPAERSMGQREFALRGELTLRGATFEWAGGSRLLDRLDFVLPRGRVTGLTGPNGAGKSTLVRILNRSVRLSAGALLLDGVPAEEFALGDYRRNVAILPGEVRLFSGTLADNVMLGRTGSTSAPMDTLTAMERIGFGDLVDRFPDRWATRVGEGGHRLSSGERQAVGLMRALVGRPTVLLVDEGVVSADAEISGLLLDAILRHAERGFVLIVSHDPSVLLRTQHLYLLAGGRIADEGSPVEVLGRRTAPGGCGMCTVSVGDDPHQPMMRQKGGDDGILR